MSAAGPPLGRYRFLAMGVELLGLVSTLHDKCFEEGWTPVAIAKLLAMPGAWGVVAVRETAGGEDEPIGFALCRATGDEGEILSIGVVPERRGEGAGQALLAHVLAQAGDAGLGVLFLEVAEDNGAAARLYRAAGFSVVGRRPGYYRRHGGERVAALVMRRDLPDTGGGNRTGRAAPER